MNTSGIFNGMRFAKMERARISFFTICILRANHNESTVSMTCVRMWRVRVDVAMVVAVVVVTVPMSVAVPEMAVVSLFIGGLFSDLRIILSLWKRGSFCESCENYQSPENFHFREISRFYQV